MKIFWALVRNDSKFEKNDRRQRSPLGGLYYGIEARWLWVAFSGLISMDSSVAALLCGVFSF